MLKTVAIVGRPNVGKSTLFNRLLGKRKALVEDLPGVTRDRHYAEVTRFARPFLLVDTGGFEPASQDHLLTQMREQTQLAVEEADLILFMMDVRDGLTAADEEIVDQLRRVAKPVLFVVNKVDSERHQEAAVEFYALGIAQFYPLSAEHGRGLGDLVDALEEHLPDGDPEPEKVDEVRIAMVGRPNVGKSSLVNRLLGYQRVLANPQAGTTRDSIDTPFVFNDRDYCLIDTAGIRRQGKVTQRLEKYSVVSALKAMSRAHVVLLVIDAGEGLTDRDLNIAGYAVEKGRAIVLVVNKWDLPDKDEQTLQRFTEEIRWRFKFLPYAPVLFVSAKTGQRVHKIMPAVEEVVHQFNRRIPTAQLNQALEEFVAKHPPALVSGRRIKFYYVAQSAVRPPTFVIFGNRPEAVHFSYQRYLQNCLRDKFAFSSVPLRLQFKGRNSGKAS